MIVLTIEKFFTAIKNSEWHSINELSHQLAVPANKLTELSKFLSKRGLIEYEEETHRIKIQPQWKLLLPEEEPTEPKTILATFIIPSKTSISLQSTKISNLSNIDLEVSVRMDNKIREVAIAT